MTQAVQHRVGETALEGAETIHDLENRFALAVRQRELLEGYIRDRLKQDKHFYKMGESEKPSLTKEGAELICLPHGLKPMYFIEGGPSDPPIQETPYQIVVRCRLMRGDLFGGEGYGSASSYVTTRQGERKPRQKDIGLCHNATLKMAQKSAYIAATLNATAASEFFTQDLEDAAGSGDERAKVTPGEATMGLCPKHQVAFQHKTGTSKVGKPYDFWACPSKDGDRFCQEKPGPRVAEKPAPPAPVVADDDVTKLFTFAKTLGVEPPAALRILDVKDWNEWVKIGGTLEQAMMQLRAKAPVKAGG